MKQLFATLLSCALVCSCDHGPTLGVATEVVIASRGVNNPRGAEACPGFNPSVSDVEHFLNAAVIITPYEEHDFFLFGDCFARGTAVFRGREATWEMRNYGTGHIILDGEFAYRIADERERRDGE